MRGCGASSRRARGSLSSLLVLTSCLPFIAAPAPAAAQAVDWAILDCQWQEGPTPDTLTLWLTIAMLESPPVGEFSADVEILFNGVPWEPPHAITAVPQPGPACPQGPGCPNPNPPCGRTAYSFKNVVWTDDWRCLFNSQQSRCGCLPAGNPVAHEKRVPKPSQAPIPSFFDVFIDPMDILPETDETNNHCVIPYSPATAVEEPGAQPWGVVKSRYL